MFRKLREKKWLMSLKFIAVIIDVDCIKLILLTVIPSLYDYSCK